MTVRLTCVPSLDALGPEWDALLAAGASLQTTRTWWEASAASALPQGTAAEFVCIEADGPTALFPMRRDADGEYGSLTTPYTCLYQPLFAPRAPKSAVHEAVVAFARHCRAWPVTRLEALDPAAPVVPILRDGLRTGGLQLRAFTHFANWHEPIAGRSWTAYLASRPGRLRETIRRKRRAFAGGGLRIEIVATGPALPAALAAYESVYPRSWKEPEPFPEFNATLVRGLAGTGALRIAVMWRENTPIAAQYWTVHDSVATVLKLAHDEAHKTLSPGTLLTAATIEHLIEAERVTALDFGRGDDPYKRAWAGERRERIGLLALNVRRPAAWLPLLRHDGGRVWRALTRR